MIHLTISHDCLFSFAVIVAIVYLFRLLLRALLKELLDRLAQRTPSHHGLICRFPCLDNIFDGFEITLVLTLIGPLVET